MERLLFCLRLLTAVAVFPILMVLLAAATLLHPVTWWRNQAPLRYGMWLLDWIKGMPLGYSYWEQYQAPAMLDEIAVHHEE
jgi:hypothetical protein